MTDQVGARGRPAPQVDPCRVYLRGELGKLAEPAWVTKFVQGVGDRDRAAFGLGGRMGVLASRFRTQAAVDTYVSALTASQARDLMVLLSTWQRSVVRWFLRDARDWRCVRVPVRMVDLGEAEDDLKPLWSELRYRLLKIASDPRLTEYEPYRSLPADRPVAYAELLADPSGERYFVFDGVHRAIQLARGGATHLSLCIGP